MVCLFQSFNLQRNIWVNAGIKKINIKIYYLDWEHDGHSNWVYIEITEWFAKQKRETLRVLKLMLKVFIINDIALYYLLTVYSFCKSLTRFLTIVLFLSSNVLAIK